MAVLRAVWIIVQVVIGYNLILPCCLCFLSLFKKFRVRSRSQAAENDYGIIVTAYEQVTAIPDVVASLLKVNYANFLIYVVADKCDVSGLCFADKRVIILRPEEALSSNTKSHFYAINRFQRPHNIVTIIDSDNLVDPEYLNELDKYFELGFKAVQGVREAKNLNTTYACLDAARDIYYHFYDGKILFQIGSSATLAGSGMAFDTQLYRDCLEHRDVSGAGFDKVLQSAIVGQNLRIAFAEKAIVYDEKTTVSEQLVKQRSRWINTWFRYFKFGFGMMAKGIRNMSLNQFAFGLILLRPPLFIFLILSLLCMAANVWLSTVAALFWGIAFALFVVGFLVALGKSAPDARIYRSLVNIPRFIFYQILSLLKARKANKYSVATTHYYNSAAEESLKVNE
jgi:cellulose synthase/poly-beta-1,6-N-acetylglucosamine synthase-like glycosyltransferase